MDYVDLPLRSTRRQPGCDVKPRGPREIFFEWPAKLPLPAEWTVLLTGFTWLPDCLIECARPALATPAELRASNSVGPGS